MKFSLVWLVHVFGVWAVSPLFAQEPFYFPITPGNVLHYTVYPDLGGASTSVVTFSNTGSYADMNGDGDTAQVWQRKYFLFSANEITLITIHKDGMLSEGLRLRDLGIPEFPAWPPTEDSSFFGVITSRSDTMIFGKRVRAFSFRHPYVGSVTIADGFGIVCGPMEDSFGKIVGHAVLSAALIDGATYNLDSSRYNFLPLCIGNEWHYQRTVTDPWFNKFISNYSQKITKDTVIAGKTYYYLWREPEGWFREDSGTVWRYDLDKHRALLYHTGYAVEGAPVGNIPSAPYGVEVVFGAQRRSVHQKFHMMILQNI